MFVPSFVRYQLFSRSAQQFFLIFGTKMQNDNAQNVTEPDFLKKIHFRPKMPEIFLQILSLVIFCTKMRIIRMPKKHGQVWFWENFFSGQKSAGNMLKILPFLQVFIRFLPNISLFFHTKLLLITMPTNKQMIQLSIKLNFKARTV